MLILPTSITDVVACGLPDMSLPGVCAIAAVMVVFNIETMGPTIVPICVAFVGVGVRCITPVVCIKTIPLLPALLLLLLLPVIIIISISSSAATVAAAASAATSSSAASSLGAVGVVVAIVVVTPIVVVGSTLLIIGALLLLGLI